MRNSPNTIVLASMVAEWGWGFCIGMMFRYLTFWRRGNGVYVPGDEYRVGFFCIVISTSLFTFRTLEMWALTGEFTPEIYWRWIASLVFAWGLTKGFQKKGGSGTSLPPVTEIPDE